MIDAILAEETSGLSERVKQLEQRPTHRPSGVGSAGVSVGTSTAIIGTNSRTIRFKGAGLSSITNSNDETTVNLSGGGITIGDAITSATLGSVLFAGVAGILAQDNANLFWDDTNNRLGIGLTSPDARLGVKATTADSTASALNVTDSANVTKLQVRNDGHVGVNMAPAGDTFVLNDASGIPSIKWYSNGSARGAIYCAGGANDFWLEGAGSSGTRIVKYYDQLMADTSNDTAAQPAINHSLDIDTGIFFTHSDVLGISCAGTERLRVTTAGLKVSGNIASAYTAQTATYAITTTDSIIDCTSGTFTATLPTAASITGQQYTIKNSGTGVITVATTSAQTIDGATTYTLVTQYDSITVVSDGSNWKIV